MPGQYDSALERLRSTTTWHVRETRYFLFHVVPELALEDEVAEVIAQSDQRHQRLRAELDLRRPLSKINYWLYDGRSLLESPETQRMIYGTANDAGVHLAQWGLGWQRCVDIMTHEEVHLVWGERVGEAPSLLNEGIAAYYERKLSARDRLHELREAWRIGTLRSITTTGGFWAAWEKGEPVYEIAGAFTQHLIATFGLEFLAGLFRETSYEDDGLAALLERKTGLSLEELELNVYA